MIQNDTVYQPIKQEMIGLQTVLTLAVHIVVVVIRARVYGRQTIALFICDALSHCGVAGGGGGGETYWFVRCRERRFS